MPEHTSLLHYLLARFDILKQIHTTSLTGHHLGYKDYEPVAMGIVLMVMIAYLATEVRALVGRARTAVVPEADLTLRTSFEVFVGYFYDMAKEVMGPKNAKRFFPLIGSCAIFIFVCNAVGLVPGLNPPTASLNVTLGCGLVVFVAFNYYGIRENGLDYLKHLAGWGVFKSPVANLALACLLFPIELISLCARPLTLAIRLMLNIAVDHLLAAIFLSLIALLLPLPLMLLGLIVICVQTLVFALLSAIYIGLATAHAEHS